LEHRRSQNKVAPIGAAVQAELLSKFAATSIDHTTTDLLSISEPTTEIEPNHKTSTNKETTSKANLENMFRDLEVPQGELGTQKTSPRNKKTNIVQPTPLPPHSSGPIFKKYVETLGTPRNNNSKVAKTCTMGSELFHVTQGSTICFMSPQWGPNRFMSP